MKKIARIWGTAAVLALLTAGAFAGETCPASGATAGAEGKAACCPSKSAEAAACGAKAAGCSAEQAAAGGIVEIANESGAGAYVLDSTVADFSLKHAQSGETKKLSELAGEKATVVVFWNKECPYVEGATGASAAIQKFAKDYADKGVKVVAIDGGVNNSETANAEYAKNFGVPLLLNPDSTIAAKFNARYTPQTFVLDKDMKVQYVGAFQTGTGAEARSHTENAVKDIIAGQAPVVREARGVGCSLKYAEGAKPKAEEKKPTT
jgi:peroxiredoxin